MIHVFKGNDLKYQSYYEHIKDMLKHEYRTHLTNPKSCDIYIYWQNPEYFASGGVCLTLCPQQQYYILSHIVTSINFDLYMRELEDEEYNYYIQLMSVQFFKAMYLKLRTLVKLQGVGDEAIDLLIPFPTAGKIILLLEIEGMQLEDCIEYGLWPCQNSQQLGEDHYRVILNFEAQSYRKYLNNLKAFYSNFDVDEEDCDV